MSGKNYRDLVVWQEAMDLVVMIYRTTAKFPKLETQTMIANRLRFINDKDASDILELIGRVGRRTQALANSLSPNE